MTVVRCRLFCKMCVNTRFFCKALEQQRERSQREREVYFIYTFILSSSLIPWRVENCHTHTHALIIFLRHTLSQRVPQSQSIAKHHNSNRFDSLKCMMIWHRSFKALNIKSQESPSDQIVDGIKVYEHIYRTSTQDRRHIHYHYHSTDFICI
jgi:hypothetical protein